MPLGSISTLTLPGDNATWSVTVYTATGDQPLKNLRHADKWTQHLRAFPLHAHRLDGEPITNVLPMSGIVDRYRRLVVADTPVVTGFVTVADAWACTNPSAGCAVSRSGSSTRCAYVTPCAKRAITRARFVDVSDRKTEAELTPWYRAQMSLDRARNAEMEAAREGRPRRPATSSRSASSCC